MMQGKTEYWIQIVKLTLTFLIISSLILSSTLVSHQYNSDGETAPVISKTPSGPAVLPAEFIEPPGNSYDMRDDDTYVITGTEYIKGTTETWSSDILVESGGSLVVDDSVLMFDTSASPVLINVSTGGKLSIINSSTLDLTKVNNSLGYFITIFGDLVIRDSTINLSGYGSCINRSSCTNPSPSNTYFAPGLSLAEGTALIENSTISNSTYGLVLEAAQLEVINCIFVYNYYALYSYQGSNLEISGTIIRNNAYGMFIVSGEDITISDCIIENNAFGIFIENTDAEIVNSTFTTNIEASIGAYFSSELTLEDCVISHDYLTYSGFNIMIDHGTLVMTDCLSAGGLWGVYVNESTAELLRTELLSNQITGIFAFRSAVTLTNGTILGSEYGALLDNCTATLSGNTIADNRLGVYAIECRPVLEYNLIARNTEYGVMSMDRTFELGAGNDFIDPEDNENGLGMFRQLCSVNIKVYDQHNNMFLFVDGVVVNGLGEEVYNGSLYVKGDVNGARIVLDQFWITNNGVNINPGPYNITVRWGDDGWGGYITAQQTVSLVGDGPKNLELKLPLPDIYISEDDIEVTSGKIKEGEDVELEITVHTSGTLNPTNTNVTVYINDEVYETITIDSFDGAESHTLKIKTKAAADGTGDAFRVWVDVENHEFEQNYYLYPYNINNTAKRSFSIEEKEGNDSGFLVRLGFFGMALIIFLISLILVLRYIHAVHAPPKEDDEPEESEEDKKPGKGRKKPGPPIKIEPPDMVRKI